METNYQKLNPIKTCHCIICGEEFQTRRAKQRMMCDKCIKQRFYNYPDTKVDSFLAKEEEIIKGKFDEVLNIEDENKRY